MILRGVFMKTKSIIAFVLSILFILSVFTACKTTEGTSTPDEVETTSSIVETTATTESAETTVTPTSEPTTTVPATEKEDRVESNSNTQTNSNSNNNTGNSSNNNSSNSTNNNTSSNNKPEPTQPKPVETEPQVITDDTPLTYDMANNAEVFQRLCDNANAYFSSLGMIYEPSLTPDNTGWYYGHCMFNNKTSTHSFNTRNSRNIEGIQYQVDGILIDYDGGKYEEIKFNTVYEVDSKGNYNIIFCYR